MVDGEVVQVVLLTEVRFPSSDQMADSVVSLD